MSNSKLSRLLYRNLLRWTKLPHVRNTPFVVSPSDFQLTKHLPGVSVIRNSTGVTETVKLCFRQFSSIDIEVGFNALRKLNSMNNLLKSRLHMNERNSKLLALIRTSSLNIFSMDKIISIDSYDKWNSVQRFRVGDIVLHKTLNFRAIVIGWELRNALNGDDILSPSNAVCNSSCATVAESLNNELAKSSRVFVYQYLKILPIWNDYSLNEYDEKYTFLNDNGSPSTLLVEDIHEPLSDFINPLRQGEYLLSAYDPSAKDESDLSLVDIVHKTKYKIEHSNNYVKLAEDKSVRSSCPNSCIASLHRVVNRDLPYFFNGFDAVLNRFVATERLVYEYPCDFDTLPPFQCVSDVPSLYSNDITADLITNTCTEGLSQLANFSLSLGTILEKGLLEIDEKEMLKDSLDQPVLLKIRERMKQLYVEILGSSSQFSYCTALADLLGKFSNLRHDVQFRVLGGKRNDLYGQYLYLLAEQHFNLQGSGIDKDTLIQQYLHQHELLTRYFLCLNEFNNAVDWQTMLMELKYSSYDKYYKYNLMFPNFVPVDRSSSGANPNTAASARYVPNPVLKTDFGMDACFNSVPKETEIQSPKIKSKFEVGEIIKLTSPEHAQEHIELRGVVCGIVYRRFHPKPVMYKLLLDIQDAEAYAEYAPGTTGVNLYYAGVSEKSGIYLAYENDTMKSISKSDCSPIDLSITNPLLMVHFTSTFNNVEKCYRPKPMLRFMFPKVCASSTSVETLMLDHDELDQEFDRVVDDLAFKHIEKTLTTLNAYICSSFSNSRVNIMPTSALTSSLSAGLSNNEFISVKTLQNMSKICPNESGFKAITRLIENNICASSENPFAMALVDELKFHLNNNDYKQVEEIARRIVRVEPDFIFPYLNILAVGLSNMQHFMENEKKSSDRDRDLYLVKAAHNVEKLFPHHLRSIESLLYHYRILSMDQGSQGSFDEETDDIEYESKGSDVKLNERNGIQHYSEYCMYHPWGPLTSNILQEKWFRRTKSDISVDEIKILESEPKHDT